MANRFVLNETSYHGKGAINSIADEVKARGFKKALVCCDPDLIKFGVADKVFNVLKGADIDYSVFSDIPTLRPTLPLKMFSTALKASRKAARTA